MTVQRHDASGFLTQAENLSRTHHEHELYYSQAPLEAAVAFQRLSRTLKALAGHWLTTEPLTVEHAHRYAGCDDLNVQAAIETLGVLFQEGEGEPAEIGRIKRELTTQAEDHEQTGAWLGEAMQSTWKSAAALLQIEPLADLLGERHRIIAANWQNASLNVIIAALLRRAVEILEIVDFAPAAIRVDLADRRLTPHYLFAAAELIDRAADLLAEGAVLVHDSERRWRVFHARIEAIRDDTPRQLRDEEPDARRHPVPALPGSPARGNARMITALMCRLEAFDVGGERCLPSHTSASASGRCRRSPTARSQPNTRSSPG